MSERALFAEAADAIAAAKHLTLACHVGPDGDALGSMLAFGIAAEAAGKKVEASFGSPFVIPPSLSFLPTELIVPPAEVRTDPEVMVVFDAGSPDRLVELAANAKRAKTLVVIDHHVTNDGFGDIALVDGSAAATGELVYQLLQVLGWEMTPDVAQCLLTALMTDTGRFQYSSTSPRTHTIAAELVAAGARPELIGRYVYDEAPFGYLKVAGAALSRAQLDAERGVVSTVITGEDLAEAGVDWTDIDNLIDLVRLAMEADVAVLVKAYGDGRIKVSLRSRGGTDVGRLAADLGGGGHRLAAGAILEGDPTVIIDRIREKIEEYRG